MEDETSRVRGRDEGSSRSQNGSATAVVRREDMNGSDSSSSSSTSTTVCPAAAHASSSPLCEATVGVYAREEEAKEPSALRILEETEEKSIRTSGGSPRHKDGKASEYSVHTTLGRGETSPSRNRTDEAPHTSDTSVGERHGEHNSPASSRTRPGERGTSDSASSHESQRQRKEPARANDGFHKKRLDRAETGEDKPNSPSLCRSSSSSSASSPRVAAQGDSSRSASSSTRASSRLPSNRVKRGYRRSEPPPSSSPAPGNFESATATVVVSSSEVRRDGLSLSFARKSPFRGDGERDKTDATACDPGGGKGKSTLNGVSPSSSEYSCVKIKAEVSCGSIAPNSAESIPLREEYRREQTNGNTEPTVAPSTPAPVSKRRRYNSRQGKLSSVPPKSRQPGASPSSSSSSSDPFQDASGTPVAEHLSWEYVGAAAVKSKSEREQVQQRTALAGLSEGKHAPSHTFSENVAAKASAGGALPAAASGSAGSVTSSQNTGKGQGSSPACRAAFVPTGMNTRKRRAQSVLNSLAESAEAVSEQHQKPSAGEGAGRNADPGGGRSPHTSPPARRGGAAGSSGATSIGSSGGGTPSSAPGAGGSSGHGEAVGSPSSVSDTAASGRFSARLRQRPGDSGRSAGPPFSVVGIPSVYVRNGASAGWCACGRGLGSLLLEPGATGGESEQAGGGSDEMSGNGSQDRVVVLPRRISASAYNNLEIRARYDICQRRIRKVETWLQMIEEWYFGSAASRCQSLHLQTVQQDQVALYNSTKEGRRIEAVRGGGDASPGMVDPVLNTASRKTGHGPGGSHTVYAGGGTVAGTSVSERGYFHASTAAPGARGGGSASSGATFAAAEVGQICEGRLPPDGGLATTDSVIYALIVSNNAERIGLMSSTGGGGTTPGSLSGSGSSGSSGASSGESTRASHSSSCSSGREASGASGTGGGGRKGEGGGGHSGKSSNHAGERATKVSRGGGRSVVQRLGATRLTPLELLTSPLRKANVVDLWGPKEVALFEAGICKYGKDFNVLQRLIRTKTTCEIVDFYYLWKQTNRYVAWKQHRHLSKTIVHSVFG